MSRLRDEATRKGLHLLLSLVAAAVVWRLPHVLAAVVLASATFVALAVELGRSASPRFARAFRRSLGPLLRDHEDRRLTGATALSIGYTVVAVLLPGIPALAGILVAGVADSLAAVVGKRFGRARYPGGKSLEGSAAFLVVTFPLLAILLPVGPWVALGLALALTVLEAFSLPVDDNFYLPLATALVIHYTLALPTVAFFS